MIQTELPEPYKAQLLETSPFDIATYNPETQILATVPSKGTLYLHFQDLLQDLWLCWELMLLAEPLVLMGTNPTVCSESVVALVDLINPVSDGSSLYFSNEDVHGLSLSLST